MSVTDQQRDWVRRVFGISAQGPIAGTPTTDDATVQQQPRGADVKLLPIWRVAKEKADSQISDMQSALRGTNTSMGDEIADGMAGVTQNVQVRLMAALYDFDSSEGEKRGEASARVVAALDPLQQLVAADPLLTHLENNPLNVGFSIRNVLGEAFSSMRKLISTAAKGPET